MGRIRTLPSAGQPVVAAGFAVLVVVPALYVIGGLAGGHGLVTWLETWGSGSAFAAGGVLCALRAWTDRDDERGAWTWFAVACGCWTAANFYYALFVAPDPIPLPSPADVGYFSFPVALSAGLVAYARGRVSDPGIDVWLDGLVAGLSSAAVAAAVLFAVGDVSTDRLSAVITTLIYPLEDVAVVGVFAGVASLLGWRLDRRLRSIAVAVACICVADGLVFSQVLNGHDSGGVWTNLGWTLGIALIAVAAWSPATRPVPLPEGGRLTLVLPVAFAACSLLVLTLAAALAFSPVAAVLALAALIVTFVRLHRSFRQVQRLAASRSLALAELRIARDTAEEASRAKSEFVSRISHELRTPLNAILGFAQLIRADDARAESAGQADQIVQAGNHLTSLIDDLLDLGSAERGELHASIERVSATEVLTATLDMARPVVAARGLELAVDAHRGMYRYVLADFQRLRQVLLNLIANAIKYNRPAGKVTVSFDQPEPGWLRFVVADTGPGIAPADLPRLFRPFDRLGADAGAEQGTGLGLALSKSLVEAMGGRIGVVSTPGEGTAFHVDLRTTEAPDPAALAALPAAGGRDLHATILYIEDNPANIRLVEDIFEQHPAVRLLTALQASSGVELAIRHQPDLILLDANLPDADGEEVLGRLLAAPETAAVPVVVVSADATPARRRAFLGRGAAAHVAKPFEVSALTKVLASVLDARARQLADRG